MSAGNQAPEGAQLPPLPPVTWPRNVGVPSWTAEEVQAYARAAVRAAQRQAERDNSAFERGYQHGRQQERQLQEARAQAPAEGDVPSLDEVLRLADEHAEESYENGDRRFDRGGLYQLVLDLLRRYREQDDPQPKGAVSCIRASCAATGCDGFCVKRDSDAGVTAAQAPAPVAEKPLPAELGEWLKAIGELYIAMGRPPFEATEPTMGVVETLREAAKRLAVQAPAVKAERPTKPGWYVVLPPDFDAPTVRAFGKDGQWWVPLGKGNGDDGWMTGREYRNWVGPIADIDDRQPFLPEAQPPVQHVKSWSPFDRGELAGDGQPCPNTHDPDCRWPNCGCRARAAFNVPAQRKEGM